MDTKYETQDLFQQGEECWTLRAWVIAHDLDKQIGPVSLERRIQLRRN